jgi:hypothetical protein
MSISNSYLTNTRFSLTFDDASLKGVELSVVEWPHPGLTRPAAMAPARTHDVPYHGSRYQWEDLSIRVQLDAQLNNYWTLYDWLLSEDTRDVILTAYGANDKPTSQIKYEGALIESLGQIPFNTGDQSDEVISIDATIKYTRFRKA